MSATVFGTGLVVAGANALNMYLERDTDALMTRTQSRPLPTGRLSPSAALARCVSVELAVRGDLRGASVCPSLYG